MTSYPPRSLKTESENPAMSFPVQWAYAFPFNNLFISKPIVTFGIFGYLSYFCIIEYICV